MMIVDDHDDDDDDDDATRWVYTCSLIKKRSIFVTHTQARTRAHLLFSLTYMTERIVFELNSFPHTTIRTVNSQNPSDAVSTA